VPLQKQTQSHTAMKLQWKRRVYVLEVIKQMSFQTGEPAPYNDKLTDEDVKKINSIGNCPAKCKSVSFMHNLFQMARTLIERQQRNVSVASKAYLSTYSCEQQETA
jgi:hypothetical protein